MVTKLLHIKDGVKARPMIIQQLKVVEKFYPGVDRGGLQHAARHPARRGAGTTGLAREGGNVGVPQRRGRGSG